MEKVIGGPCGRVTFSPAQMKDWFQIVCISNSREELENRGVTFKRNLYRGKKRATLNLTTIQRMLETRQQRFIEGIIARLDSVHPEWRTTRDRTRTTLPKGVQDQFVIHSDPEQWKIDMALGVLSWVDLEPDVAMARHLSKKIDAVLVLIDSLARQVATSNYKFEERHSDVADILQLYYLVDERFCFVTQEKRLVQLIKDSTQISRVLDFSTFVRQLVEQR
jgi:hypothetical protein